MKANESPRKSAAKILRMILKIMIGIILFLIILVAVLYCASHNSNAEIGVSLDNHTSKSIRVIEMSIGKNRKRFDKVVEANARSFAYIEKDPFLIKDDRWSNLFSMTLKDGEIQQCTIANKDFFEYCGLKVAVLSTHEIRCICDGPGDFGSK